MEGSQRGFEHLEVWRRSVDLSVDLFKKLKGVRDRGFRDHITRTAMSVPSNIAEGYERNTDKDSMRFYSIAKGSCGELRTQVIIGIRAEYIDPDAGKKWIHETREISAMLVGLINSKSKAAGDRPQESGKAKE